MTCQSKNSWWWWFFEAKRQLADLYSKLDDFSVKGNVWKSTSFESSAPLHIRYLVMHNEQKSEIFLGGYILIVTGLDGLD